MHSTFLIFLFVLTPVFIITVEVLKASIVDAPSTAAFCAGDPHFRLFNKEFVTCNVDDQVLVKTKYWRAFLRTTTVGAGSALTDLDVEFLTNATSLNISSSGWTNAVGNVGTKYEYALTQDELSFPNIGTKLSLFVSGSHLNVIVQLGTKDHPTAGILHAGCDASDVVNITGAAVSGECAHLSEPYRDFCNYDLEQSGDELAYVQSAEFVQNLGPPTSMPTYSPSSSPGTASPTVSPATPAPTDLPTLSPTTS